ncbi:MAG: hypothetical protein MJ172_09605 [Clostridia bacterium]|nr:hypothetical protein [Clostridia bacterium]
MADWNTHLYCAQKVNETLKFEGLEKDMFLFGNLMPDVNAGWLISPKTKIDQPITHFEAIGQGYFWCPHTFYSKYQAEIHKKNPLMLGYLFHLWLDVKIMTDFVSRVPMSKMLSNGYEVRSYKWKDMSVFIDDKKQCLDASPENLKKIAEATKLISEIDVVEEDLVKVEDFLKKLLNEPSEYQYMIYTEQDFVDFYEKTCDDFTQWVLNLENM